MTEEKKHKQRWEECIKLKKNANGLPRKFIPSPQYCKNNCKEIICIHNTNIKAKKSIKNKNETLHHTKVRGFQI